MTKPQHDLNILSVLLHTKDLNLLQRLSAALLTTDEPRAIYLQVARYFADKGEIPGWDTLGAIIDAKVPEGKKSFYLQLLQQLRQRDTTGIDLEEVLGELVAHYKTRMIVAKVDTMLEAARAGDSATALAELNHLYEDVVTGEDADPGYDQWDLVNLTGKKEEFLFRSTGIDKVDQRGGLIQGGLTIIAAYAKQGKSTLAMQWAMHSYEKYEGSVAFFSWEQSPFELRNRMWASKSEMADLGRIMANQLTSDEIRHLRQCAAQFLTTAGINDDRELQTFVTQHNSLSEEEFWSTLWQHFEPRENRFLLINNHTDWDNLFVQMEMLRRTRNVRVFVLDYPYLIPRGSQDRHLASWEYALLQNKKLKQFASRNKCWVITPAQYDPNTDSLKFVKNAINDCDLLISLRENEEDKQANTVTVHFDAYRNFLSVPGEPTLEDFKLVKDFAHSRFRNLY